jgi:glycosyltransferase involved in cell wall biosynthesis
VPNKLLIITYYWPPSSGAGVQRWLKFSKYLPELGWEPIILTVDPEFAAYPVTDNSLTKDFPPSVKVHKTRTIDYFSFYKKDKTKIPIAGFANSVDNTLIGKIQRFVRGNFFIPDPRKGWNKFAFNKACELIESEGIKYVITTSPPHSSQLIGLKIRKKYPEVKWIADLRDPWTNIYYYDQFYPTFISKAIDRRFEKQVLKSADRIITVGKSLKNHFSEKLTGIKNKIDVVPNGFDEDDFAGLTASTPRRFTLSYIGTLSDSYPVDGLLEALVELRKSGLDFILRFVGTVSPKQKKLLLSKLYEQELEFIPYVDHEAAIKYMLNTTLLLLIIPDHKSNKSIITGKIFEYIATGKPVICLGPVDGDAAEIINQSNLGKTFEYFDNQSIQKFVKDFKENKINREDIPSPGFSRKNLTAELASILRGLD